LKQSNYKNELFCVLQITEVPVSLPRMWLPVSVTLPYTWWNS
jgi:hypothetical protein